MAAGEQSQEVDFKKVSVEDAFKILNCTEAGLTSAEVEKRLAEYGPNKLPESSRNPILVYLGYMWNPLSWAMEVAAILAIILLDYADFALIVALLILNATISYVEESNADKAIKALTAALAPKARVKRDGKVSSVDASGLVPGDIIVIQFGNIVPADIKLLGEVGEEDQPLQVDQAALTGESLPVRKFTGDVAFGGSTVKQGEKECLVYATGMNTFFGRAAALIAETNNVANLQKIMTRIGAICLITIAVWCVIELTVQFGGYRHRCGMGEDQCPTLTNLLVIIVGGIPIAMPTVLSVTLALGAYKLAKEGAIVARMSAVEEMAGMNILCSDKTGTLTLNKLTTEKGSVLCMGGRSLEEVLKLSALSANIISEEPIDMVLHHSYDGHATLWDAHVSTKFVPFNPVDKYTINHVKVKADGEAAVGMRIMKGAPQVVLRHAHNCDEINTLVSSKIVEFAGRGFRALGIATAPDDGTKVADAKWEFIALIPLFDPPRHDTAETVRRCKEKGIMVKMVTGDQLLIGKETAKQLGMGTTMYTTDTLMHAKDGKGSLPEGATSLGELVEAADGFAEVFPEHKFEIVRILQSRNHLVGMTGDGVNDAPALKKANVGIAVDGATDAARGAADIVLTQPGLSVIVTAVIGARKIFQRMTTYSKYTVAMTFRICFTFGLLSVIYDWYFPTILIVLLAVFNDGAMIALSKDRTVASPVPNVWNLPNIFAVGIVYGLYLTLSSWALYYTATHTDFFENSCKLFSLNTTQDHLTKACLSLVSAQKLNAAATACTAYPGQPECNTVNILEQCIAEQRWVRNSVVRTLIYNQVSISGQALVVVVRTNRWSLIDRAGMLTYIAFFAAQVGSTLIAGLGFGGYSFPSGFTGGKFVQLSNGHDPLFLAASGNKVPRANTEAEFVQSIIGCGAYVLVAWIWSILWYLPLDPIKWGANWVLNEEGVRDRGLFKKQQEAGRMEAAALNQAEHEGQLVGSIARGSWANPLGRTSLRVPTVQELERASLARVSVHAVPP